MELIKDVYTIQKINVLDICEQFGTPLYVYDGEKIVTQLNTLKSAFQGVDLKIKYAAKALTNLSVLRLLRKHESGIDVVSIQEVQLAIHAGFSRAEIMFTPNGVSFDEIVEAVDAGVSINIDNLPTLQKFGARYGKTKACSLRLNPGIMAGGNYKISTGHNQSKFGISIQQLPQIIEVVKQFNISISGLHIHTGSEVSDLAIFLKVADVLFSTASQFPALTFLDFGGGFKVSYKKDDAVTDISALGSALTKAFIQFCEKYGRPIQLVIEPGKFLVSEAGVLLAKTNVVKETPELIFVHINSGLNHLLRPMMYDAYHEIINVSNPKGVEKLYNVVGYICETDTVGSDRKLNEVKEGDVLAIKNAGAYGFSMASNYNSRLRPAEVLVINGEAKLIREREIFEDLLNKQVEIIL